MTEKMLSTLNTSVFLGLKHVFTSVSRVAAGLMKIEAAMFSSPLRKAASGLSRRLFSAFDVTRMIGGELCRL